jgi:superfamily I DNA/RNA helicase
VLATERWLLDQLRQQTAAGHAMVPSDRAGIITETVHRFKGLEAEVVLLLVPRVIDNLDRLAYVGMSRAKAVLEVIGPGGSAEALGWTS